MLRRCARLNGVSRTMSTSRRRSFSVTAAALSSGRGRQRLLQLAGFVHLHHDVRAADELAVDIELRDRGPARIRLDALADVVVLEDVDRLQVFDSAGLEDLYRTAGEAAH